MSGYLIIQLFILATFCSACYHYIANDEDPKKHCCKMIIKSHPYNHPHLGFFDCETIRYFILILFFFLVNLSKMNFNASYYDKKIGMVD